MLNTCKVANFNTQSIAYDISNIHKLDNCIIKMCISFSEKRDLSGREGHLSAVINTTNWSSREMPHPKLSGSSQRKEMGGVIPSGAHARPTTSPCVDYPYKYSSQGSHDSVIHLDVCLLKWFINSLDCFCFCWICL